MNQNKHTPGPWRILPEESDKSYIRIRATQPGTRFKIANVPTPVYDGVHPRELIETRANAHLIAAAPDLLIVALDFLEALSEQGLLCECGEFDCRTSRARDAIRKARGEQP